MGGGPLLQMKISKLQSLITATVTSPLFPSTATVHNSKLLRKKMTGLSYGWSFLRAHKNSSFNENQMCVKGETVCSDQQKQPAKKCGEVDWVNILAPFKISSASPRFLLCGIALAGQSKRSFRGSPLLSVLWHELT